MVTLSAIKKSNRILRTRGDFIFDVINHAFMILLLVIMLYPLYYTVIASVSSLDELALGNVYFLPKGFNFNAYKNVFINNQIWTGYGNSIFYMAGAVVYQLTIMLPLAYALSKKNLFGRGVVSWFFLFTMYFNGGLVPTFFLMRDLGLVNNRLIMIVGTVNVFNLIVTRTFFQSSIPADIYESAKIDGANEFRCFFRIALPLSGAVVAVMALYAAVSSWNSYFTALVYFTTKTNLYPLQLVLRNILILNQEMMMNRDFFDSLGSDVQQLVIQRARMAETMKYAVVFISSAPLLIAYPFVQRFFVKGVMIGSVKG